MNYEDAVEHAAALLAPFTNESSQPETDRLYVTIDAACLLDAVTALVVDGGWGYLAAITGIDLGVEAGQIEVLYHFCCAGPAVVTLRLFLDRTAPTVQSLFSVIPSVTFYERELIEMYGVTVEGTPNTDKLFLPDGWPAGVYPMRKDFDPGQITGA